MSVICACRQNESPIEELANRVARRVWPLLAGAPELAGLYAGYFISVQHAVFEYLTRRFRGSRTAPGGWTLLTFDEPGNGQGFAEWMTVCIVDALDGLKRGVAGLRIGMVQLDELKDTAEEVAAHYREAGALLAELGARVEPVRLQGLSFLDLQRQVSVILSAEGYQVHRAWIERKDAPFDPHVQRRLLAGKSVSAADYIEGLGHMARARREMAAFLADYDALLTPTTPLAAIPLAEVDESASPAASRYTRAVNYLGLCALALPMGFTAAGLPTSLQIIGNPFAEPTVLRIGWAFEQACPLLAQRRPDLGTLLKG